MVADAHWTDETFSKSASVAGCGQDCSAAVADIRRPLFRHYGLVLRRAFGWFGCRFPAAVDAAQGMAGSTPIGTDRWMRSTGSAVHTALMSQTQIRPVAPPKPKANWRLIGIILAVVAVLLALAFGSSLADKGNEADQPAAVSSPAAPLQSAAAPAAVDTSGLMAYWTDTCKTIDGCNVVTAPPSWDGSTLTVRTDLFPDSDAKAPAMALCGALSGFWIYGPGGSANFHAVRVLDKAGNVLVSRNTFGETCSWRR